MNKVPKSSVYSKKLLVPENERSKITLAGLVRVEDLKRSRAQLTWARLEPRAITEAANVSSRQRLKGKDQS